MGYNPKEFNPAEMDEAAMYAENQLNELDDAGNFRMDPESVKLVAGWFKRNYMAAGHKRLGRILVQKA